MRVWRPLLLATALAALAGCASEGPGFGLTSDLEASAEAGAAVGITVAAPLWTPGSRWTWSDGYGLEVAEVTGAETLFRRTDAPGLWLRRRGFVLDSSQGPTRLREGVFRTGDPDAGLVLTGDAPLTYRREFTSGGEAKVHATSWTVEGRERIAVPAGTFDTIILVMRSRNLTGDWTSFERWWYAPAVQNYVRLEYRYGAMPTASRVLVAYSLAGVPRDVAAPGASERPGGDAAASAPPTESGPAPARLRLEEGDRGPGVTLHLQPLQVPPVALRPPRPESLAPTAPALPPDSLAAAAGFGQRPETVTLAEPPRRVRRLVRR